MHLLFLDESGKIDQGGLFALGGIAVRDTDWPELRRVWQETLSAAGWPLDREIKWHGIRKGEVPPALADAVFAALAAAPFTAYVTLLDLELGPEREPDFFRSPEDIYATGLMFLAERFHHLLDAEDDLGLIVVDSRFREDDQRLRRFFSDLTKDGTPYMQLAANHRGSLPRPEPLLDRTPVRRPDRGHDRERRARPRSGPRLHEEAAAALRRASRDRGARRGRPQALSGAGSAITGRVEALRVNLVAIAYRSSSTAWS